MGAGHSGHVTRILLLENPHVSADDVFTQYGWEVQRIPHALSEDELIEALDGVDVVGLRSKTHLTARVLEAHPSLQAIGAFCIGTNQIDIPTASKLGIAIFNAPFSNTRSVVEMVVSEIIALARHIPARHQEMRQGIWNKSSSGSHEVRGKTLGIIGYGSIGTQLSVIAEALGMRVLFYDKVEKLAIGNARRARSLKQLLRESDFVSLHVDGRKDNDGFFNRELIETMKDGAILINLARGKVVDLEALAERLRDGSLAGAGLDVYPEEPAANGEPFHTVVEDIPNVILTPHIGGSTLEAQEDIGGYVAMKLANYLRKGSTELSVNVPEIATTPTSEALYRVGWMHHNTPGALAYVNRLFADQGANIVSQQLATSGEYGYMVTDISSDLPPHAISELEAQDSSVRVRIMRRDH